MENNSISLSTVSPGNTVRVAQVEAGRGLRQRLAALGLLPGATIKVVKTLGKGQAIVEIFNSKTLLGRGVTDKIYVTLSVS